MSINLHEIKFYMAYRLTERDKEFIDRHKHLSPDELSKIMEAPLSSIEAYRVSRKDKKREYLKNDDIFEEKEKIIRHKGTYSNYRPYDY